MPVDDRGKICLNDGEALVMHVREWKVERKRIIPRSGKGFRFLNVIVLKADEVNGQAQEAEYYVTSEKLATAIMPFLESGAHTSRSLVLVAEGEGQRRTITYQTHPRG